MLNDTACHLANAAEHVHTSRPAAAVPAELDLVPLSQCGESAALICCNTRQLKPVSSPQRYLRLLDLLGVVTKQLKVPEASLIEMPKGINFKLAHESVRQTLPVRDSGHSSEKVSSKLLAMLTEGVSCWRSRVT
eukprot:6485776-Amphidinium_carterae.1